MSRRVLLFDVSGRGGGSNVSLRIYIDALDRRRYEPRLAFGTPADPRHWAGVPADILPLARLDNYDFFPAGLRLPWLYHFGRWMLRFPGDFVRAVRFVRQACPALVHINAGQALTLGLAARALRLPVVWHIREMLCRNGLGRFQQCIYSRCSGHVIAVSNAVAARLPACRDKMTVIHNPVSLAQVRPEEVTEFKRRLGIAEPVFIVLLMGSLSTAKGGLFLAEVADRLDSSADILFLLAGERDEVPADRGHRALRFAYRRLLRTAGERACVQQRWHRHVEARRALFCGYVDGRVATAASDLVVCPNTIPESFGRTVIEAAVQARPVIATAIEPFDETIEPGVTGWLLPLSAPLWSEKIANLYRDRQTLQRAGEAAAQRAERFNPALHAQQIVAIYDRLLNAVS